VLAADITNRMDLFRNKPAATVISDKLSSNGRNSHHVGPPTSRACRRRLNYPCVRDVTPGGNLKKSVAGFWRIIEGCRRLIVGLLSGGRRQDYDWGLRVGSTKAQLL